MMVSNNQLNSLQLRQLQDLMASCKAADGYCIPVYPHLLEQNRPRMGNRLLYQDHLIGFASVYFFYEAACEVIILIDPDFRRQGLANAMLASLLPLIKAEKMTKLIFPIVPMASQQWLNNRRLVHQQSEFEMVRDCAGKETVHEKRLAIRLASVDDVSFLCEMDALCFGETSPNMASRYRLLIEDAAYSLYIAFLNDIPIGKAHVHWSSHGARLSDIAIRPDLQKQGFGQELISHCINDAVEKNKQPLYLDVQTKNKNAVRLYKKLNFTTVNICEFWSIETADLELDGYPPPL